MTSNMALAENLRNLRIKHGLSQKELAAAIGVSYPRISEMESGHANPTLNTLVDLARHFKVPVSKLLDEPKETSRKKIAKSA